MASNGSQTMQNIIDFAQEARSQQQSALSDSVTTTPAPEYADRLDRTIRELRERVRQQRLALVEIKASSICGVAITRNPTDKRERLHQLRTVKIAFDRLTQSEPTLPAPDSALPFVLALRTLQRTITGSKDAIATTRKDLAASQAQLSRDKRSLENAQTVNAALRARIASLEQSATARAERSPHDVANAMVGARQAKKLDYERETLRLHDALVKFTREYLGAMLAAEELGGPVVGDELEVDDADLADGFAKGRKRKAGAMDEDGRQRRIDEIWGMQGDDGHGHGRTARPLNGREAAAKEAHGLIERLIQALIGATGEGVYVRLERDSAAARFLVRAKVAQYHPRDARRLCLIDFGREFDS